MRDQLSGVLVLHKPAEVSSAKVVSKVKKLMGAAKAGHAGTLDPFATGVLVCCINQATRLAGFFLRGTKTYEAVLHLGIETDTQDATGGIVRQARIPEIKESDLQLLFNTFIGQQMQQPPVHAALKHQGVPLYKLARQGRPVQKPARPIFIETLRLLDMDLPRVRFEVRCSAGTYIRTLCADMGAALGCGGHLEKLHRTAGSGFSIEESVLLERLESLDPAARTNLLIPMADTLRAMPMLTAGPDLLQRVAHGQKLTNTHLPQSQIEIPAGTGHPDHVKVVDAGNNLKAVLQKTPDGKGYNYCCVFK